MSNVDLIEKLRTRSYGGDRDALNYRGGLMSDAAAALEAMEWQPIETAPKDKTKVLVCCNEKGPIIAKQAGSGVWINVFNSRPEFRLLEGEESPTHWWPLPNPPKEAGE